MELFFLAGQNFIFYTWTEEVAAAARPDWAKD